MPCVKINTVGMNNGVWVIERNRRNAIIANGHILKAVTVHSGNDRICGATSKPCVPSEATTFIQKTEMKIRMQIIPTTWPEL
jgi:hypothetical protein